MCKEYRYQVKELMEDFNTIPIDPTAQTIKEDWRGFPTGTHREIIWHWFDEMYNVSVGDLMYTETMYEGTDIYTPEILFRAKEKETGIWVNGLLSHPAATEHGVVIDYHFTKLDNYAQTLVKACTVGRSSGKKDIYEKKIFEGDFLKSTFDGIIALVKYGHYLSSCPVDGVRMDGLGFYLSHENYPDMPLGSTNYSMVIGNIWDNSELLPVLEFH